jgi:hypothetical protein
MLRAFIWLATALASIPMIASTATAPTPIEVEVVQARASQCAPGPGGFDEGFRAALSEPQLVVTDSAHVSRTIANAFCLASQRPHVKPLRIRVRIGGDASMNMDYLAGAPNEMIRTEEHWLVHMAVPFHGIRPLPGAWRRSSFWARSDRASACDTIGRVIALYVLEALHQETGRIRSGERMVLGPDVSRDRKYSESDKWGLPTKPWRSSYLPPKHRAPPARPR